MIAESNPRRALIILICIALVVAAGFYLLKGRILKSDSESLVIHADAPCKVNVDGDEMILSQPGVTTIEVASGQHLVSAVSLEEKTVTWEDLVYVENGKELPVTIRLAAKIAAAKQNKSSLTIE